jgi:hypothetical protein
MTMRRQHADRAMTAGNGLTIWSSKGTVSQVVDALGSRLGGADSCMACAMSTRTSFAAERVFWLTSLHASTTSTTRLAINCSSASRYVGTSEPEVVTCQNGQLPAGTGENSLHLHLTVNTMPGTVSMHLLALLLRRHHGSLVCFLAGSHVKLQVWAGVQEQDDGLQAAQPEAARG